jgi:16S rRNA (cytosine1402-N4)-methyltransferase
VTSIDISYYDLLHYLSTMSDKKTYHHNNSHTPVLLERVLQLLAPKSKESYLDLTAGYGGHAKSVLTNMGDASLLTLVDRDANAISALTDLEHRGAQLIHTDYATAVADMLKSDKRFDMILLDLGVSSPHLDNAERGFSFQHSAPLDMRMDQRQSLTAEQVVNIYSEAELTRVLKEYGEEPKAKKIAKSIIEHRPVQTTDQLAAIVTKHYGRWQKSHPATRTFQALRIEVNNELTQLEQTLPGAVELLKLGGRIAVISFHSLEDRIVKQFFKQEADGSYEARLKLLTKKPILGKLDDVLNPRARSAKLRAAVKINT